MPVPTLRQALVFWAAAASFATCFMLLRSVIGSASPWLGLLLMFYFMGLAKLGEPFFMFRMPGPIREVRAWESTGPAYRWLGVPQFELVLRASQNRRMNAAVYLAGGRDLQSLYRHAGAAEATHFWAALLFTPYIALVWAQGDRAIAVLFLLIQVVINVYPILHLRLLRGRLDAVFAKQLAQHALRQEGQGCEQASGRANADRSV